MSNEQKPPDPFILDSLHDHLAGALLEFMKATRGMMDTSKKNDEGMNSKADFAQFVEALGFATGNSEPAFRTYAYIAEHGKWPTEEIKWGDQDPIEYQVFNDRLNKLRDIFVQIEEEAVKMHADEKFGGNTIKEAAARGELVMCRKIFLAFYDLFPTE